MGMQWTQEMEQRFQRYRETAKAWELIHEEAGFEDLGVMADAALSDLDGAETHTHLQAAESKPGERK